MRFHLDEHVAHAIAHGLRRRGIDVTTTVETGLLSAPDDDHLASGDSPEAKWRESEAAQSLPLFLFFVDQLHKLRKLFCIVLHFHQQYIGSDAVLSPAMIALLDAVERDGGRDAL